MDSTSEEARDGKNDEYHDFEALFGNSEDYWTLSSPSPHLTLLLVIVPLSEAFRRHCVRFVDMCGSASIKNRVLGAIRFRRMLPLEVEASRIAVGVVRMEHCPRKQRRAFIRRECSLCAER